MREDIQIIRPETNEPDILERIIRQLGRDIARYKFVLFSGIILGGILGYAFSYTKPKLYTSSAQILPEFKANSASSGLSSLSSLAGLNISGQSVDAFRPELFPNVLQSTAAMIYLLKQPVKTSDNKQYTSMIEYLEVVQGRKFKLSALLEKDNDPRVWQFTPDEMRLIRTVRGPLTTNFDKKSGITEISFEMTDPLVASFSAANLIDYLRNYLTTYLGTKKEEQVQFLITRVAEAKKRREKAEYNLKNYQDHNKNVVVQTVQIRGQKLQEDLEQAQGIYLDLNRQLEKSKIDEMQNEPLFMILENPIVPVSKSSPRRVYYGAGGAFAGLIVCCIGIVAIGQFQKRRRKQKFS